MAIFHRLYQKVMHWSCHDHAPYYLAGVSFAESSFFPIPPDVMLIPMVLTKPLKAWQYATITTIASILGGIIGYLIGYYAFGLMGKPIIEFFNAANQYDKIAQWFDHYGIWMVILAGVTPIPYKIFTIAAGAAFMPLVPFILASILGRGLRFFGVVGIIKTLGKRMEPIIVKYIDKIGWLMILLMGLIGVGYYCFK